jgi:hypothetical protein
MCRSLGSALKIKLVVLDVHGADEIERGLTAFATEQMPPFSSLRTL